MATTNKNKWDQPGEVTPGEVMFGAAEEKYPMMAEIPDEFKRHGGTIWNNVFSQWFYKGIKVDVFVPKKGIDKEKALMYIGALMRSWAPKHEHKEAAVAYLMSLWFEEPEKGSF